MGMMFPIGGETSSVIVWSIVAIINTQMNSI